jgi:hypothetical protein
MKAPYVLSAVLAALMMVQSVLGRVYPGQYRDAQWIRLTWLGNDWFTLAVAVPLLVASLLLSQRGSVRGLLLWLGTLGYGAYNYAYYMLGAALNVFFPIYVAALLVSMASLILALSRIDVARLERVANRVALCKDDKHGHLLEGSQDQGSRRGGSGHLQERRCRNVLHLSNDPQTLAEDEEGRQGPLAGYFHGTQKAHPRHHRGEEGFVEPA